MDPIVLAELTKGADLTDIVNGRPVFTAPTNYNVTLTSAMTFVRNEEDFLGAHRTTQATISKGN